MFDLIFILRYHVTYIICSDVMKHWENCKPSNRSFLEEDVKQLYKMRSEFVHGNIRFSNYYQQRLM